MVGAQIFKDQVMAHELRSQAGFKQGVLVAGNGHIRKDYGVPMFLKGTVSIAFLEVQENKTELSDYGVDLYVCSQATAYKKINKSDINKNITEALSGSSVLLNYQLNGYALMQ